MATLTTTSKLDVGNLPMQPIDALGNPSESFAIWAAQDMAMVHNCLMRAWNSIYQQAPRVVAKDYPDFITYALSWHRVIEIHHDGEEEDLYPNMEKTMNSVGFFAAAIIEHGTFHDGLDRFKAYLEECKAEPSKYSGTKLVEIMNSFGEALYTHMNAEPQLLLTIKDVDEPALRKNWEDHVKKVLGGASMFTELPLVWANFDATFEDSKWADFPPIPAPVKWFMRNVAPRWYSNIWKFGSTTTTGYPQELYALREGYGK